MNNLGLLITRPDHAEILDRGCGTTGSSSTNFLEACKCKTYLGQQVIFRLMLLSRSAKTMHVDLHPLQFRDAFVSD